MKSAKIIAFCSSLTLKAARAAPLPLTTPMSERLATDVFAFRDVQLRITRRDVSGGGADGAEASGEVARR